MKAIPKMPEEYKGENQKNGGYTKSTPRKWTPSEIEWVKKLMEDGFTNREIAESIDRTEAATKIKIKKLSKKEYTYNDKHIVDKRQANIEFINYIKPQTIIDVYAGNKSFYSSYQVISNDKNKNADTNYHLDALKFCCQMYVEDKKADIVDLDPFGSAYDCFDLAIKMAKKGLIITFGELGHKRWKRLDYVKRYYDINTLEEFTLDSLIKEVQKIGRKNKKDLIVYSKKEWMNIGRVYFEIRPIKITEQWEETQD